MDCQRRVSSMRAPSPCGDVICVLIFEDSSDSLAKQHRAGRGRVVPRERYPQVFRRAVSQALSVLLPDGLRFFQPLTTAAPTARLTVMPARRCTGRRDGVSTLHMVDYHEQDRWVLDTEGLKRFRAGTLVPCILTLACTRWGARLQPDSPGGLLLLLTMRTDLWISSPYCSHPGPYPDGASGWDSASRLPPDSVRCRMGFILRHQRNGSTPS